MTLIGYLVLALVVMTTIAAAEAYVLIGRFQLMRNDLDLLLAAARQLLGAVPSKSAPRTVATADVQPRRWWQRLSAADTGRPTTGRHRQLEADDSSGDD